MKPKKRNAPERRSVLWRGGCIFFIAAAATVRIFAALNDLWLDEVISVEFAAQVESALDIFTKYHHELNHHLSTLWIFLAGQRGNWAGYRLASALAGIGSVVLVGLIGRRRSEASGIFSLLLAAFSYVLVVYSTEARGYSMAVFFSLLAFYSLEIFLEKKRWPLAMLFSGSMALALLSHLASASVLFTALAWFLFRVGRSRTLLKHAILQMAECFALPALLLGALYFTQIRQMVNSGGNPAPLLPTYAAALAWALGAPWFRQLNFLFCAIAVVIFCAGLRLLWERKSDAPAFFAGIIVVFPLLLVVSRKSDAIYVRYFLFSIVFLLILFGEWLASLYEKGKGQRIFCFLILGAYLIANGWHIATFYKFGRGHYGDAVRFIAQNSNGPIISVGGDHDMRIPVVLQFHWNDLKPGKEAQYFEQGSWPPGGVEWIICHKESVESPTPPGLQITDKDNNHYEFVRAFPTAPLSGLHWFLYRNTRQSFKATRTE